MVLAAVVLLIIGIGKFEGMRMCYMKTFIFVVVQTSNI